MRDIVATIQPEQDDIVRADAATTVCVQGAPGTGKTAVGLHRVAYLLYAHKEQVTRRGVVVVGPNLAFLSYIRNVLPALGELDVTQTTVADLVASTPIKGTDTDEAAMVKGDARMAEVLRNALWAHIARPGKRSWSAAARDGCACPRTRSKRSPASSATAASGTGPAASCSRTASRTSCSPSSKRPARPATTAPTTRSAGPRRYESAWTRSGRRSTRRSWSSPFSQIKSQVLRSGSGLLSDAEMTAITWPKPPRGPGSAPWTRADQVLIDEAADLIERTPSIAHIVVDEAQDLSPMEVRAIGRRCATGAATVLGDIAQGTTPWAATSWPTLLFHLGKPDASVRELDVGYRVPRQILDFASRLLPSIAPDSPRPSPCAPTRTRSPSSLSPRGTRRAGGGGLRDGARRTRLRGSDLRRRRHTGNRGGRARGGPGLHRSRIGQHGLGRRESGLEQTGLK